MKLINNQPISLLGENIYPTYQSSKWDSSLLSASNIYGYSKYFLDNSNEKSIRIAKYDMFYIKIDSSFIYKIDIIQEGMDILTLSFTRS